MTGFAVHQFYKRSNKCPICLDYLTTDKEFMIDLHKYSRFAYLEIVDRGSLKWPSDTILRAVVILWKIFVGIDNDISLMKELVQGPSKQILVSLAIQYIENNCNETWGDTCSSCLLAYFAQSVWCNRELPDLQ